MSLPPFPSDQSKILVAVRNPMIFNALSILVVAGVLSAILYSDLTTAKIVFAALGLAFIAAITIWLNYFAWENPRFLAYGPREYIRESELEHERKMAAGSSQKLNQGGLQ